MSNAPEDAQVVSGEGTDLESAIAAAAEALGVPPHKVSHKIDLSHFRSASGGSRPRDTVKVLAWINNDAPEEAPEKPARSSSKKPGLKGAEETTTEASEFAAEWFGQLLEYLHIEGKVTGTGTEERVHLLVEPKSRAGRLIGKRGSTLASIRHLLGLALEAHGSPVIDVDVEERGAKVVGDVTATGIAAVAVTVTGVDVIATVAAVTATAAAVTVTVTVVVVTGIVGAARASTPRPRSRRSPVVRPRRLARPARPSPSTWSSTATTAAWCTSRWPRSTA